MLDSYSEGQAIYGRDDEILQISESIADNVQTFIYGKSGIGKTSLIQAGVFPNLRKQHFFPVVIRLAFYEKESLRSVVKRLVQEEAVREDENIFKVPLSFYTIDGSDVSEAPLYEYFAKMCFVDATGTQFVPVLIFDQFEETINNEDNWQRTVDFLKDDIYDLVDDSIAIRGQAVDYTNYRLVFSMREDYLYCLEDIIDRYSLWELRYNRFRVRALDDESARLVIKLTCGDYGLEPGNEERIINTVIKIVKINSGSRFKEINTALLSLVCSLLSENAIEGCIRFKDLRQINSNLASYYDSICDKIGSSATRYLESHLLTKDGRRSSIDENEALSSGKISQEQLDYLVEQRLLRRIKTDSTSRRYEYIHDLFAKLVHKRRYEASVSLYRPAFRIMSRKMDVGLFAGRSLITIIVIAMIGYLCLLFHNYYVHGILDFIHVINPTICVNNFVYFIFATFTIYLVPLFVQRFHDTGHSGWFLMLLPTAIFLIAGNHYFALSHEVFTRVCGYLLLFGFLILCFSPTSSKIFKPSLSIEYQSVTNKAIIDNKQFMKFIIIECLCVLVSCFFSELCYYSFTDIKYWKILHLPLVPLDKFGIIVKLPAFLAVFPFVLCFSPTLHARVRSVGYKEWLPYIPYINILFMLIGLLPDGLLKKLRLIRNRDNSAPLSEDSILLELNDSLLSVKPLNTNSSTQLFISIAGLLIPFFLIIRSFRKSLSVRERWEHIIISVANYCIYYAACSVALCLGMNADIIAIPIIFFSVTFLILSIMAVSSFNKSTMKTIIKILESSQRLSTDQIAAELNLYPYKGYVNKVWKLLNKLCKEGKLLKEFCGDITVWMLNKKA